VPLRTPIGLRLVSDTRRNAEDHGGMRRTAHNPATTGASVTAEVTATTPRNDSLKLTATAAHGKVVASYQVVALN
jgi:hypothetical protein